MTKLAELVSDDVSFAEKMKINVRRFGLAGVGLISLVDNERERLYKQILEMGESYGGSDTIVGRISLIGTGTLNLMREETLRVFDELVEEGEQAWSKERKSVALGIDKISKPRSVGRNTTGSVKESANRARKSIEAKATSLADSALETAAGLKADAESLLESAENKASEAKAKVKAAYDELTDEMKQRFDEVKLMLSDLDGLSDEAQLEVKALIKQIREGDVKGRRPAQSKIEQCAEFDARKAIKGMKPKEALLELEKKIKQTVEEATH